MRVFVLTMLFTVGMSAPGAFAQDHPGHDHAGNDHGSDEHEHVGDDHPHAENHTDLMHAEAHGGAEHPAAVSVSEVLTGPRKWEFWGALFNFSLLIFIFVRFGKAPIGNFLKQRRRQVEEGLKEAKAMKEAAEAKHAEYSNRLAKLDQELAGIRAEMVQAGESERDRIVKEAEVKAERLRKETQFLIDQQMKQLRVDLTEEAANAAIEAAKQALTAKTSTSDQQRLADEYLKSLQGMSGSTP